MIPTIPHIARRPSSNLAAAARFLPLGSHRFVPHLPEQPSAEVAWAVAFDLEGALWAARSYGITRVAPDGTIRTLPLRFQDQVVPNFGWIPTMVTHRQRGVWLQAIHVWPWDVPQTVLETDE